jgi:L-2-hydroxyglutarate oxidase
MERVDLIVIGGGIVGLATASRYLSRFPRRRVVVLEKEDRVAAHQTGRNSGVIHSGLYYKPGSLKAANCRRGLRMMESFADEHGVPRERCGKVVVAVDDEEAARLPGLVERGIANGVACRRISGDELRELEPACAGVAAIRVEDTGIIDYAGVCRALHTQIVRSGGDIEFSARVVSVEPAGDGVIIGTRDGKAFRAASCVNCAGLHSDRVARLAGAAPALRIVPFRGEYFDLRPGARPLVRGLVYPVPDPSFPFLGVHFTRMIARDGHGHRVECGPNAVLAFAREGYTKSAVHPGDLADTLSYPAFWRLALRHWRTGAGEVHRSVSKAAFVRALRRLIPDITGDDLERAPAGVRAQALGSDGALLDDFSVIERGPVVHVCNAPSPAATASFAIGDTIVDTLSGERGRGF